MSQPANPLSASHLKPGSRILDVACGSGALGLMVARDALSVHGIDFSAAILDTFRLKANAAGLGNINLHCGDAQQLPYNDETFDAAFSIFGLMFFPARNKGFAEIYRTLKPAAASPSPAERRWTSRPRCKPV